MSGMPTEVIPGPAKPADMMVLVRGLAGAVVGGIAGYFAFYALYKSGLYGIMIPGVILGLAAGLAARGKSIPLGIICALAAIPLAIYSEWTIGPFRKDPSLTFFIANIHHLPTVKLVMMAIGAACAYWFGQGR